ncbi:MAG: PQQ-dependent sugar dehydrogenase, partial [Anaerolineales bacterium]|nr:PQQ-dependent sugar dehydrogenase [Anaerolineales bacterium]
MWNSRRELPITSSLLVSLGLLLAVGLAACIPTPSLPAASSASPQPTALFATPSAPTSEPELPTTPATETPISSPTPILYRNTFPDPALYFWSPIASGFEQPVDIQNAGDGSGRLFIVEKGGRIRILANWLPLPDPFLDIHKRVGSKGYEQGLLGLAFHPNFEQNGYFYVNYTDTFGNTVVSRFQVSADDPNRADPNSELILLRVEQP